MLFNSVSFFIFLALSILLFYLVPVRFRRHLVLILSYGFYSFWDWRFTFLLLFTTLFDYFNALGMADSKTQRRKNFFFLMSLTVNIGVLFFFKYYNFVAFNFVGLFSGMGLDIHPFFINVVLPVGVSFYTLQALSYTIDVWRGQLPAARSPIDFANYVAFFPQLVAGPIERAPHLLKQMGFEKLPSRELIDQGLALMTLGFIKKVFFGDTLAPLVDDIFNNYQNLSTLDLWVGALGFTLQIYFDFSGYSDIARGVAKFFNVDLMVNFKQPYLQSNITNAWRAWHISLSTWIRDYVYFPMGGGRANSTRVYFNILFSMILVGFWHGANWTYIVFGAIHGIYLCLHKWLKTLPAFASLQSPWFTGVILTQFLVVVPYVLFRAPDIHFAWNYYQLMFSVPTLELQPLLIIFTMIGALLCVDLPSLYFRSDDYLIRIPKRYRYSIFIFILLACLILIVNRQDEARPFIYFQF